MLQSVEYCATSLQVCAVQVPPAAVHSAWVFLLSPGPDPGGQVVHKGSRTFPMTVKPLAKQT